MSISNSYGVKIDGWVIADGRTMVVHLPLSFIWNQYLMSNNKLSESMKKKYIYFTANQIWTVPAVSYSCSFDLIVGPESLSKCWKKFLNERKYAINI